MVADNNERGKTLTELGIFGVTGGNIWLQFTIAAFEGGIVPQAFRGVTFSLSPDTPAKVSEGKTVWLKQVSPEEELKVQRVVVPSDLAIFVRVDSDS